MNELKNIVNEMQLEIQEKKELIIQKRIIELLDVEIDFEQEKQRRFHRFVIENQGNKETVYFNDGTLSGKRIVTFVRKENNEGCLSSEQPFGFSYSYF